MKITSNLAQRVNPISLIYSYNVLNFLEISIFITHSFLTHVRNGEYYQSRWSPINCIKGICTLVFIMSIFLRKCLFMLIFHLLFGWWPASFLPSIITFLLTSIFTTCISCTCIHTLAPTVTGLLVRAEKRLQLNYIFSDWYVESIDPSTAENFANYCSTDQVEKANSTEVMFIVLCSAYPCLHLCFAF